MVLLGLAAFVSAQENNIVVPSAEGFTIYQTIVSTYTLQDPSVKITPPTDLKREYSRHPDGREVLAQAFPGLVKDFGNQLHGRLIWEPNGVVTSVILPWKHTQTTVDPGLSWL